MPGAVELEQRLWIAEIEPAQVDVAWADEEGAVEKAPRGDIHPQDQLEELELPYVRSLPKLRAAVADGDSAAALFGGFEAPDRSHPTEHGREVLLEAFAQGLRGEFDGS